MLNKKASTQFNLSEFNPVRWTLLTVFRVHINWAAERATESRTKRKRKYCSQKCQIEKASVWVEFCIGCVVFDSLY